MFLLATKTATSNNRLVMWIFSEKLDTYRLA